MRPIFANSACVSVPGALVEQGGGLARRNLRVRFGLFRHPQAGWVLIDTGYGPAVTSRPGRSLALRLYAAVLRPQLREMPVAFLARQGLQPADISLVILTHYHADHVAGLAAFAPARILAPGAALAAIRARGPIANLRHGIFSELLPADLEARLSPLEHCPLSATHPGGRDIFGDGALIALDLPGHAEGHFGLYFTAERLLYAVDCDWLARVLIGGGVPKTADLVATDPKAAAQSRARVQSLVAQGAQLLLCHDPDPSPWDVAEIFAS